MSGSILGTVLGMGLASQQAANRLAEQDRDHRRKMDAIQAGKRSSDILRQQMQTKNTHELIQAEAKKTRVWVNDANDNINDVHRHIDDQTTGLMKFVGEKEDEQTGLIREVLTVVGELSDKVDHLQAEIEHLKSEHA